MHIYIQHTKGGYNKILMYIKLQKRNEHVVYVVDGHVIVTMNI